jgi:hypothetical protein
MCSGRRRYAGKICNYLGKSRLKIVKFGSKETRHGPPDRLTRRGVLLAGSYAEGEEDEGLARRLSWRAGTQKAGGNPAAIEGKA